MDETLGELLRRRRVELGLSQSQVADMLGRMGVGVHSHSISRWETGASTPEPWNLEALLDGLGVTGPDRDAAVVLAHRSRMSHVAPDSNVA